MKTDEPKSSTPPAASKESSVQAGKVSDIEWQKLELDRQRFQWEVESRAATSGLELEKLALDRAKERTAKLQLILPIAISMFAIIGSAMTENYRARMSFDMQRAQFENQLRLQERSDKERKLELFKQLAEKSKDKQEIMQTYKELFPDNKEQVGKNSLE